MLAPQSGVVLMDPEHMPDMRWVRADERHGVRWGLGDILFPLRHGDLSVRVRPGNREW